MEKNLTVELEKYKEEFGFLYKKIGELEWERVTTFYGKKAVKKSEIELIEDQIENYKISIEILEEKIKNYIRDNKENK